MGKQMDNRIKKLLRAAIEHQRAGLKEYGSRSTNQRIAWLRDMQARSKRASLAHERAVDAPIIRTPHPTIPPSPPSRLDALRQIVKSFFGKRGNR